MLYPFSAAGFVAAACYLLVGGHVLKVRASSQPNRLFALICLLLASWAVASSLYISAPSKDAAWLWYHVSAPCWLGLPAALLAFHARFTGWDHGLSRPARAGLAFLLFVPAGIFMARNVTATATVHDHVLSALGWSAVAAADLWDHAYTVYYLIFLVVGLYLVYRWGRDASTPRLRRQARVLLVSGFVALTAVLLMHRLLPELGVLLPPTAPMLLLVWVFGAWYAMSEHRPMMLTPEAAAEDILQTMADALLLIDGQGRIRGTNQAAVALLGARGSEELRGRLIDEIFPKDPLLGTLDGAVSSLPQHVRNHATMLELPGGRSVPLNVSASSVLDRRGRWLGVVVILRDISLEQEREQQLKHLASHDPLTDLPNRVLLQDRLQQTISRAVRHKRSFAVLLVDLDRFKEVNDTLGHDQGDLLLKLVAYRLASLVRECDTVARLGGDEFVLVLDDLSGPNNAGEVAQRILASFSLPFQLQDRPTHVTCSLGVSVYPKDGPTLENLLKNADIAMYQSKERGGNAFTYFKPAMHEDLLRRVNMERALREALEGHQLSLVYQPLFDLERGTISGIEALLRWQHPEWGTIGPRDFLPIAEVSGLVVPIGEWVLRAACAQNRKWQLRGIPPSTVSVNVSPRQLQEAGFADLVQHVLKETGLAPQHLQIEIAENTVMQKPEDASKVLHRLHELGVSLVIDGFGAGYSSYRRLKELPFQAIKLDPFFIRDVAADPSAAGIVRSIITLAHSLNRRVVAEGVETAEQLSFLRSTSWNPIPMARCDQAQGFLFCQPRPPEELEPLLSGELDLESLSK